MDLKEKNNIIEIIENANIATLVGIFYQNYGSQNIDDFYRLLTSYRDLEVSLKQESSFCKELFPIIFDIMSHYKGDDESIKKNVFLIFKETININRDITIPVKKDAVGNDLVKITVGKTNLYFQKNAITPLGIEITEDTRVITILKNSEVYISFTTEKIKGVSYSLTYNSETPDVGKTTNFNKELVDKVRAGFYKIINEKIKTNDGIFYKLEYIKP